MEKSNWIDSSRNDCEEPNRQVRDFVKPMKALPLGDDRWCEPDKQSVKKSPNR